MDTGRSRHNSTLATPLPPTVTPVSDTSSEIRRQHLWIVLPAYNEEASLPPLLQRLEAAMLEAPMPYHVVIVDDGSSDGTWQVMQDAAQRMPIVALRHEVNQGLGATIRDGLTHAAEVAHADDVIVSLDADNSHPPGLIARMVSAVREGNDVVIASRYQPGSAIRGVPLFRRALSYWGGWLFRIVFPIAGVRDYTCGFRAYRGEVLQHALQQQGDAFFDQDGFQCMVDILLKLSRYPWVFAEVPLVLRYDLKGGVSKMRVGSTIFNTLALLLRRRLGG